MQNEEHDIAALKQRFLDIYKTSIKREGADKLLDYLLSPKSDFFYMDRPRVKELYNLTADDETITLISLLHDICKVNFYKTDYRNAKNDRGVWEKVPYYTIDDTLPYGHGEKSVYIITGFMRLTREEAFAIRFHMGFSGTEDINLVGRAFEKFPLAYALHAADMEASYFLER